MPIRSRDLTYGYIMAIFTYFEDPAYVKEIFLLPLHNTGGIIVVKEDLIYVSVDDQNRKMENIAQQTNLLQFSTRVLPCVDDSRHVIY